MELLSPAGTLEAGMAALHYGADAVYLGMKDFSARADAGNFTLEDLSVLLGCAHGNQDWRRKVYVAVNTLVREEELPQLAELLARLRDLEVDALIVQDQAVLQLAREYFPELELHASTQMALHNTEGVIQAGEMGYKRVVAARELTVQELSSMAEVPGMEIEAFIHGALCYSYSGLCLLSACLNGASGNRGSCTYVCRNKFHIVSGSGKDYGSCCPFSMKDLALGDLIPALTKAGVASLKIEGRKKTPLYVAAVTNYYRKLLDGTFKEGEEKQAQLDVKTIFSRPWTKFHALSTRAAGITDPKTTGPRGFEMGQAQKIRKTGEADYLRFTVHTRTLEKHDGLQLELPGIEKPYGFGVDEILAFSQAGNDRGERVFQAEPGTTVEVPLPQGHPEIPAGSKICCTSSQEVKRRYQWTMPRPSLCKTRIPVFFHLKVSTGSLALISQVSLGGRELEDLETTVPAELQPAKDPEKNAAGIKDALSRLGDTDFRLEGLRISNPEDLFVPKSALNELRRQAAAEIEEAIAAHRAAEDESIQAAIREWQPQAEDKPEIRWSIKLDSPHLLNVFPQEELADIHEFVFAIERTSPKELPETLERLAEIAGGRNRIRLSIPAVVRKAKGFDWGKVIPELVRRGWRRWEIGNIGAMQFLAGGGTDIANLNITGDSSLYTMNSMAAKAWLNTGLRQLTVCPEDTLDNMLELTEKLGDKLTVVVWQDTVLARSAVCAMTSINSFCPGRENCSFRRLNLTNTKGEKVIAVNSNCSTVILSAEPLDYSRSLRQFARAGAVNMRADFLWLDHAPAEVLATWRRLRSAL